MTKILSTAIPLNRHRTVLKSLFLVNLIAFVSIHQILLLLLSHQVYFKRIINLSKCEQIQA